jgi:hypothetical protein
MRVDFLLNIVGIACGFPRPKMTGLSEQDGGGRETRADCVLES